jgi:DNA repair exonuclease SbcCD nuclease subunit
MSYLFLIFTDTHFYAPGSLHPEKSWWNRVLEAYSEEITTNLIRTVRQVKPDFIVHCGDLTGYCDAKNFAFSCQVMAAMNCPWYVVPGNHDTWFPGVRAALSLMYKLPKEQCHYALNLAGLKFIFLDVAYWHSKEANISPYLDRELYDSGKIVGMGPSPAEVMWFAQELDATTQEPIPVVVVSHAPLSFKPTYPTHTLPHGIPAPNKKTSLVAVIGDIAYRNSLRSLIKQSKQVVLALAGHWHIHDKHREGNVIYCQTASLREYPFELRQCIVHPDRLVISTISLNNPKLNRLSYVPDWGNAWIRGTAGDREFSIPLPKYPRN